MSIRKLNLSKRFTHVVRIVSKKKTEIDALSATKEIRIVKKTRSTAKTEKDSQLKILQSSQVNVNQCK